MTLIESYQLTIPDADDLSDRLSRLEARIDELEEMLGLKDRVHFDHRLELSRTHERFLNLLLGSSRLSKLMAFASLYGDRAEESQPTGNVLSVHVSKLRMKLKPYGIKIKNVHGWGWELLPEDRIKLHKLMT